MVKLLLRETPLTIELVRRSNFKQMESAPLPERALARDLGGVDGAIG